MAKQHLISLRDASSRTGLTEEVIRKQIDSGAIGGEKKSFFLWDEWFVQRSDLEKMKQLANKKLAAVGAGKAGKAEFEKTEVRRSDASRSHANKTDLSTTNASNTNATVKSQETKTQESETEENDLHYPNPEGISTVIVPMHVAEEIERAFIPNTFNQAFASSTGKVDISSLEISASPDSPQAVYPREQMLAETEGHFLTDPIHLISRADDTISGASVLESERKNTDEEAWTEYRSRAKSVAEEFLAPLIRRLELQASMLQEKDLLIAEQAAQLRLLPDFQRKTEDSVRLAKEKEKEAAELRQKMTWERQKSLIKLSAWQMKHLQVERKIRDTEDELAILQDQKETEVAELRSQLKDLQARLAEQHKPWWKKIALSKEV